MPPGESRANAWIIFRAPNFPVRKKWRKLWRADLPTQQTWDPIWFGQSLVWPHVNSWLNFDWSTPITSIFFHMPTNVFAWHPHVPEYMPSESCEPQRGILFKNPGTSKFCTATLRVTESQPRRHLRKQKEPCLDTSSGKKRFFLLLPVHGTVIRLPCNIFAGSCLPHAVAAYFIWTTGKTLLQPQLVPRHQEHNWYPSSRHYKYNLYASTNTATRCNLSSNQQHGVIRRLIGWIRC